MKAGDVPRRDRGTGVRGEGYSMGIVAADFDNDGATDLYVTGVNRNILYRNERGQTFSDVTEQAGVSGIGPGAQETVVGGCGLAGLRQRF